MKLTAFCLLFLLSFSLASSPRVVMEVSSSSSSSSWQKEAVAAKGDKVELVFALKLASPSKLQDAFYAVSGN